MLSITLKFVLVIAVTTGQLFGGVSCCCLWQDIIAECLPGVSVAQAELSAFRPAREGACPKCVSKAKKSPTGRSCCSSGTRSDRPSLCDDGECSCVKLADGSCTISKSMLSVIVHHPGFCCFHDARILSAGFTYTFSKFDIPVRYGGHSWQTIACIWRI